MEQKERFQKWIKNLIKLLVIGFLYLIFVRITGRGIPCVFSVVTGIQCPGCGITRAIVALSRGNFEKALEYNAMCLSVYPILVLYFCYRSYRSIKYNYNGFSLWEIVFLFIMFVIVILYALERNAII